MVSDHPGGSAAKEGQANMEKLEKILVRIEEIPVRMEKISVYSWQDWSCSLETVPRGLSLGHMRYVACSTEDSRIGRIV